MNTEKLIADLKAIRQDWLNREEPDEFGYDNTDDMVEAERLEAAAEVAGAVLAVIDIHGSDPTTRFARGQWPRCVCGYAPRDNTKLNEHFRENGFEEVDDHGQILRRSYP